MTVWCDDDVVAYVRASSAPELRHHHPDSTEPPHRLTALSLTALNPTQARRRSAR
jgi:hypothetical protein